MSECAASDRIASDPLATPTIPFASVNPPEAAIELSATFSFWSCIRPPCCGDMPRVATGDSAVRPPLQNTLFVGRDPPNLASQELIREELKWLGWRASVLLHYSPLWACRRPRRRRAIPRAIS